MLVNINHSVFNIAMKIFPVVDSLLNRRVEDEEDEVDYSRDEEIEVTELMDEEFLVKGTKH